MIKKRIVFWFLLVAFAAGTLFWLFHVPYRPGDLYRVIPSNAVFVSHHHKLAERWDDFSANPLARALFTSMGLDVDELALWGDDPETRVWFDKLLAHDLVIAHTPGMGAAREPAWIVAGWIGGDSIRLRWLLLRGKLEGFEKVPRQAADAYWLVDTGEESELQLSIGVVEGMLIGVYSEDPHAMRYVLDAYDGVARGHLLAREDAWPDGACGHETNLDRGWFIGPDERGEDAAYFFGFEQVDERGVRGALCRRAPGAMPAMRPRDIEIPSRLFGDVPFALVGLHPEAAYTRWLDEWPPALQEVIRGLSETSMAEFLVLAVMGGDYAGTMAGLSVPAVMAAWPVADEAQALAEAQRLLDGLNAAFRWGLVSTETRIADRSVYVVESTADTAYSSFRFRERIAFSLVDGWMVLSSHSFPLMQLLGRYGRPEAIIDADQGGWQRELREGTAAAFGYVDLHGGARTLRLAISAWSVKLLFDDPQGTRETRQRLNELRAWIDTLEPMGGARLWLDQDGDWLTLHFALGEQGKDEQ